MTRRTNADVARETIVAERGAILTFARTRCAVIDRLLSVGKIGADEATEHKRLLRTFADDVAIGLHRDGHDPDGVRDALRPLVRLNREGAAFRLLDGVMHDGKPT